MVLNNLINVRNKPQSTRRINLTNTSGTVTESIFKEENEKLKRTAVSLSFVTKRSLSVLEI